MIALGGATRGYAKSEAAEAVVPASGGNARLSAEEWGRKCGAAEWPLRHCVVVHRRAYACCCYCRVSAGIDRTGSGSLPDHNALGPHPCGPCRDLYSAKRSRHSPAVKRRFLAVSSRNTTSRPERGQVHFHPIGRRPHSRDASRRRVGGDFRFRAQHPKARVRKHGRNQDLRRLSEDSMTRRWQEACRVRPMPWRRRRVATPADRG